MKPLQQNFAQLADAWEKHCRGIVLSSDVRDYLNHSSFRGLVDLGDGILPFVIQRYENDDFLFWGFVLEEIVAGGPAVDRNRFDPQQMRAQWISWWKSVATTRTV